MRRQSARVSGFLAFSGLLCGWVLLLGGCAPRAATLKPGLLDLRPPLTVSERMEMEKRTVIAGLLAKEGCRGIWFERSTFGVERFRDVERVGVKIASRSDADLAGYARHHIAIRLGPSRARERSETLATELVDLADSREVLVTISFDRVVAEGRYSHVVPIYDREVPVVCIVLDLDKVAANRSYTDVGNEMAYDLALVRPYRGFWEENVATGRIASTVSLRMNYTDNISMLKRREETALECESELRRERYFDYLGTAASLFDAGEESGSSVGSIPGRLRPLEFRDETADPARDHAGYHSNWARKPPYHEMGELTIEVRHGWKGGGEYHTVRLPYVPYTGEGRAPSVITPREYKDRWFDYFRREICEEGTRCPYCRSVAPGSARFPDAATPLEWFTEDRVFVDE